MENYLDQLVKFTGCPFIPFVISIEQYREYQCWPESVQTTGPFTRSSYEGCIGCWRSIRSMSPIPSCPARNIGGGIQCKCYGEIMFDWLHTSHTKYPFFFKNKWLHVHLICNLMLQFKLSHVGLCKGFAICISLKLVVDKITLS